MANTALKKITTRAKQLQKKHPGSKWTSLIKKAGAEYRSGKLGAARHKKSPKRKQNRQTGTSNKFYDKSHRAKPPGKRRSATGKTYYERRKNRSDMPGQLTGVTAGSLINELKKRLKKKIDKAVVSKYHATKKRLKNKYQRTITETKSELRKLS
jgi:hypothetical protein